MYINASCSCSAHQNTKISPMETAFEEMGFEWEFLHPKGSAAAHQQDLELNCFTSRRQAPEQGEELDDESAGEEIYQEPTELSCENQAMDEVFAVEEDISFEAVEGDFDWDLQSLLFKEEEEGEVGEAAQRTDPEIYAKDGCGAFGLKTWLKSALMAAATLSIFILGGGRMQFTGNNQRIQAAANRKEEVKVQHQQAASSSSSLSGHYDERF